MLLHNYVRYRLPHAKAELKSKAVPGDTGAEEMLKQINRSLKKNEKRK